jgi:hypothetical protein
MIRRDVTRLPVVSIYRAWALNRDGILTTEGPLQNEMTLFNPFFFFFLLLETS